MKKLRRAVTVASIVSLTLSLSHQAIAEEITPSTTTASSLVTASATPESEEVEDSRDISASDEEKESKNAPVPELNEEAVGIINDFMDSYREGVEDKVEGANEMDLPRKARPLLSGNTCAPVHLVTINGTGESNENANTDINDDKGVMNKLPYNTMKAHPGKVSTYLVPYPASAGAIYSVNPNTKSPTTFGESRLRGDARGMMHLEEYMAKCPQSAIAFYGYSQGASVAGDLAALAANGAIKGLNKDKILGAILIADPGRSGKSRYNGPSEAVKYWIPHPPGAQYERNGEMTVIGNEKNNVGLTGQRSLGFNGIEGRVLSFCVDKDMACSTAPGNTPIRAVADFSDKNIKPNLGYTYGNPMYLIALTNPKVLEFIPELLKVLLGGTISEAVDKQIDSVKKQGLDPVTEMATINFFDEIKELFKVFHREDVFGASVPDIQILIHLVSKAGSQFMHMLPPQLRNMKDQIVGGAQLINTISSVVIPDGKALAINAMIEEIADFPNHHGDYFGSRTNINGKTANDWATDALIEGVGNYLQGRSMSFSGTPGPREREIAEANRADDGLKSLFNGGWNDYIFTREKLSEELKKIQKENNDAINIPEEDGDPKKDGILPKGDQKKSDGSNSENPTNEKDKVKRPFEKTQGGSSNVVGDGSVTNTNTPSSGGTVVTSGETTSPEAVEEKDILEDKEMFMDKYGDLYYIDEDGSRVYVNQNVDDKQKELRRKDEKALRSITNNGSSSREIGGTSSNGSSSSSISSTSSTTKPTTSSGNTSNRLEARYPSVDTGGAVKEGMIVKIRNLFS